MRSYKEGRYLIFELSEGRDVRYDLSDGSYIGLSGKKVKNLCEQLRGYDVYDIIKSFEDPKYRKFLFRVYNTITNDVTNTGTFLRKVRKYKRLEQYIISGIENVDSYISYELSELPSGLVNLIRNNKDLTLYNGFVKAYKSNPDLFNNCFSLNFKMLSKRNVSDVLAGNYRSTACFYYLVKEHNYNPVRLLQYIDNLMYYEGIENHANILGEIRDYARMCRLISRRGKFEKYPKNFLTTHAITVRNYKRLNKCYNEKDFIARINLKMEYRYKDYVFIYPKCTDDIKFEAVNLNHCVASYIDGVIEGDHDIIFLRKADSVDDSLITLEVIDDEVTHAAGLFNREPNKSELEAIDKYNEYLGGE